MVGSKSPLSSRAVAQRLARVLPQVELVELDGLGHMGPITHPDKVNDADRPLPRAARRMTRDGRYALALSGQVDARRVVRPGRARTPAACAATASSPCAARMESSAAARTAGASASSKACLPFAPSSPANGRRSPFPMAGACASTIRLSIAPSRALLGMPVTLAREGDVSHFDASPIHLVSSGVARVAAVAAAAEPRGRATLPAEHHR